MSFNNDSDDDCNVLKNTEMYREYVFVFSAILKRTERR